MDPRALRHISRYALDRQRGLTVWTDCKTRRDVAIWALELAPASCVTEVENLRRRGLGVTGGRATGRTRQGGGTTSGSLKIESRGENRTRRALRGVRAGPRPRAASETLARRVGNRRGAGRVVRDFDGVL